MEQEIPNTPLKVLFVCGRNKWRSPTAEHVFGDYPGVESLSAGINHDSETVISSELVEWADIIFVMEPSHKAKLSARFGSHLKNSRVVCLNIPDKFQAMDPTLVEIFRRRVKPHLC